MLGAAEVELRTLLGDVEVHALELPLSRGQKLEGQLHLKLRWETNVAEWSAADEANARVSKLHHAPTDLTSSKQKLDKYGSGVDLYGARVSLLEGSQDKVRTHAHTAQCMHMPNCTTGVRQDIAYTQLSREVPSAQ